MEDGTCISYREAIDTLVNEKFGGNTETALRLYTDSFSDYIKAETFAILQQDSFYFDERGKIQVFPCTTNIEPPYCGYIELYTFLKNFK